MPSQLLQWTEYITCPVCSNIYNDTSLQPYTLGCGHTICKCCLSGFEGKKCPLHPSPVVISTEGLPVNEVIVRLLGGQAIKQTSDIASLIGHENIRWYESSMVYIENLAMYLKAASQETESNESVNGFESSVLSRPMQRKLITLLNSQLVEDEGRLRAARCARSLGERTVTELILFHQNPQQLSAYLWAAVRARGCQFLGPAMQGEVLKLVLLALQNGEALSRKVLVLFVVQHLEKYYPQASKTASGHVVQLLYRASCFKVTKRQDDSSLMQLKEEFRTYDSLRREHDSQIVQMATEAGLRIAPEQWSSLLYGDVAHKSHMQSIIDKLQTPQSFVQSVSELLIAVQRTGDPGNLARLRVHLELLANIDTSADAVSPSWPNLESVMQATWTIVSGLVEFIQANVLYKHSGDLPSVYISKYKTSMCRDYVQRATCPRGVSCTFAHNQDEMERHRSKNRRGKIQVKRMSDLTTEAVTLYRPTRNDTDMTRLTSAGVAASRSSFIVTRGILSPVDPMTSSLTTTTAVYGGLMADDDDDDDDDDDNDDDGDVTSNQFPVMSASLIQLTSNHRNKFDVERLLPKQTNGTSLSSSIDPCYQSWLQVSHEAYLCGTGCDCVPGSECGACALIMSPFDCRPLETCDDVSHRCQEVTSLAVSPVIRHSQPEQTSIPTFDDDLTPPICIPLFDSTIQPIWNQNDFIHPIKNQTDLFTRPPFATNGGQKSLIRMPYYRWSHHTNGQCSLPSDLTSAFVSQPQHNLISSGQTERSVVGDIDASAAAPDTVYLTSTLRHLKQTEDYENGYEEDNYIESADASIWGPVSAVVLTSSSGNAYIQGTTCSHPPMACRRYEDCADNTCLEVLIPSLMTQSNGVVAGDEDVEFMWFTRDPQASEDEDIFIPFDPPLVSKYGPISRLDKLKLHNSRPLDADVLLSPSVAAMTTMYGAPFSAVSSAPVTAAAVAPHQLPPSRYAATPYVSTNNGRQTAHIKLGTGHLMQTSLSTDNTIGNVGHVTTIRAIDSPTTVDDYDDYDDEQVLIGLEHVQLLADEHHVTNMAMGGRKTNLYTSLADLKMESPAAPGVTNCNDPCNLGDQQQQRLHGNRGKLDRIVVSALKGEFQGNRYKAEEMTKLAVISGNYTRFNLSRGSTLRFDLEGQFSRKNVKVRGQINHFEFLVE